MIKLLKSLLPQRIKKIIRKFLGGHTRKFSSYSYTHNEQLIRQDTEIGKFCSISNNVYIAPGNHPIEWLSTSPAFYYPAGYDLGKAELQEKINQLNNSKKCIIGNDVWIGANVVIMQGICIGDGAIIGANAVVTKNIPPYAIAAGVPAKIIRYRFAPSTVEILLNIKWWNKPMSVLRQLSIQKPENDIAFLKDYINSINQRKLCFIITSVIYTCEECLSYSSQRSVFTAEMRIMQTEKTIQSIRFHCPNAHIFMVDGGEREPIITESVDSFVYVGNVPKVKKAVNSRYKGLGEAHMLLEALKKLGSYEYFIKLSGRYYLNDKFDLADFDFDAFNFVNYTRGGLASGVGKYKYGSHSTRLYGFPGNRLPEFEAGLKKSLTRLSHGVGIEYALPYALRKQYFYYRDQIGVSGHCGVDKQYIEE